MALFDEIGFDNTCLKRILYNSFKRSLVNFLNQEEKIRKGKSKLQNK